MVRLLMAVLLLFALGGCCALLDGDDAEPVAFNITLTPEQAFALPGQRFVLLATVANETMGSAAGAVTISASCPGADVSVEGGSIEPGDVAEITIIPAGMAALTVSVAGERGGLTDSATAQLTMFEGYEEGMAGPIAQLGQEELDRIMPWLAANHPELGITAQTQWTGAMPSPLLIVEHYLFFSDEWELHIGWHVMIPPYDWTKYELRRRFSETQYSQGFVISSRSAEPALDPEVMVPENTLWR